MCGIVGLVGTSPVNVSLYDALTVLQHRGQDSAGIFTCYDGLMHHHKDNGLVRDVFRRRHMASLAGNMGIGHVRYPTAGSSGPELAQPFYVNFPYGIALAHNGNLTNARQLAVELSESDLRHLDTDSDTEVLLNVFARELQEQGRLKPEADDIFAAVRGVHKRCRGAYAVCALVADHGVLGFRDPLGIRPAVFGMRDTDGGREYMIASESSALAVLGFSLIRDLMPGEAIYIEKNGTVHTCQCADNPVLTPCIFEHVYFARPDSIMDGVSIYKARLRQGERLADKVLRLRPEHDIDVVIPIPDTSRVAAQAMAQSLGVKFREGLMKNRYIGRTFIMPGQEMRVRSVRRKLNAIDLEFRGKNVMLVDDSIVRGTTSGQIIEMAREAGARKVYFASAAPPVRHANVYGIDMPSVQELIAHDRHPDEIAALIGADWLVYQDLAELVACSVGGSQPIGHFETSVFDGHYATGDVDEDYLNALHEQRNDSNKVLDVGLADAGDGQVI